MSLRFLGTQRGRLSVLPSMVTMVGISSLQLLWWWWACAAMGAAEADEHSAVKYKDPKQPVAVRVEDLLSRMTLEEKIGQMVQIERSVATAEIMRNYSIDVLQMGTLSHDSATAAGAKVGTSPNSTFAEKCTWALFGAGIAMLIQFVIKVCT